MSTYRQGVTVSNISPPESKPIDWIVIKKGTNQTIIVHTKYWYDAIQEGWKHFGAPVDAMKKRG